MALFPSPGAMQGTGGWQTKQTGVGKGAVGFWAGVSLIPSTPTHSHLGGAVGVGLMGWGQASCDWAGRCWALSLAGCGWPGSSGAGLSWEKAGWR